MGGDLSGRKKGRPGERNGVHHSRGRGAARGQWHDPSDWGKAQVGTE